MKSNDGFELILESMALTRLSKKYYLYIILFFLKKKDKLIYYCE
jgi:hypothetical protein